MPCSMCHAAFPLPEAPCTPGNQVPCMSRLLLSQLFHVCLALWVSSLPTSNPRCILRLGPRSYSLLSTHSPPQPAPNLHASVLSSKWITNIFSRARPSPELRASIATWKSLKSLKGYIYLPSLHTNVHRCMHWHTCTWMHTGTHTFFDQRNNLFLLLASLFLLIAPPPCHPLFFR